jgi:hypothetical protein
MSPTQLPQLVRVANRFVRTDVPLDRADDLLGLLSTVDLSKVDRAVFGPKTFAAKASGTNYVLRLSACKSWINRHFPPARAMGGWTAAGPAGSVAPSVAPSAAP